ncbi:MAG: hypothetical protein QXQ53_04840 [Candidatus Methanosuratincola sp.]
MVKEKDDDIEFATKEDLEEIAKNEALQRVYNAMKAGVTKKFQSWAEEKRAWEAERNKLTSTLNAYEDALRQWEEWRPFIESYLSGQLPLEEEEVEEPWSRRKGQKEEPDLSHFIRKDEAENMLRQLQNELSTMRRMFDLSLQLDDLRRTHSTKYPDVEFDARKILSVALEKGYPSLEDAYLAAYKDHFIQKEVDSRLKSRLEEEMAKLKAPSETGATAPTHFELPKEAPKSFSEATKQVLEELKSGTLSK